MKSMLPSGASRDHPRGCGAHSSTRRAAKSMLGSSPRVRGSPCVALREYEQVGIIPAGAGLTLGEIRGLSRGRDHPRGCGAHCLFVCIVSTEQGSSPRVRGSQETDKTDSWDAGIIPAGAGLTRIAITVSSNVRDHPRGCGAHSRPPSGTARASGSSPRVRGSHPG